MRTDSGARGHKHGLGEESKAGGGVGGTGVALRPPKSLALAAAAEIAQASGSQSQPPQDLEGISSRTRLQLN